MQSSIRRSIGFLLVALIGATGVELAAARGQAPAVGIMEICTGTGPVHVLVDEDGTPTGGTVICPDYAIAGLVDLERNEPAVARHEIWGKLWTATYELVSAGRKAPAEMARGPPRFV
ncbi:hypothetical protein [Marivita sp. GX14005]|uniref:hypothetical protein n=1 Tax=Marivita sp. GX14005 TaxID=2942276 RepID=UPI002019FE8C|nr:hypothetical protein [Marivita sp. GX14005]MCL3880954.1 hypothetical protein [Marivita sp. GX14005]